MFLPFHFRRLVAVFLACLALGTVLAQDLDIPPEIPRAFPVKKPKPASVAVAEEEKPAPWSFGEPLYLEEPEVLWSHSTMFGTPFYSVREGVPVYRWDSSQGWPGRLVPDVSEKTMLDSPAEIAKIDLGDEPSFWDSAAFWHLLPPEEGQVVYRMFCTVYYTPKETGFTAEGGFDMTPATYSGLGGHKFPQSFLNAVRIEGFGRMKNPISGNNYIKYDGRWGYKKRSLGNRNNTLVPRLSAAVNRRNPLFGKGSSLIILEPSVFNALGTIDWEVADTGGGLHWWQVDLYWDEDDPLGPGSDVYRPKHCPLAVTGWIPVAIKK